MKPLSVKSSFFVFLLWVLPPLYAQRPVSFDSPEYEYKTAIELFQKEKYGSAQQVFKYVYENSLDKQHDIKSNSYFYMGVCAANLYNNDAIFLLTDFIRRYPVHTFVPEARYFLGKFYFHKRQYKKALEHYEQIDERSVKPEDMAEYYFKKGYSYFETKKTDQAKFYFEKARNSSGPYRLRAVYYLAHLAYQEGQYQTALESFQSLRNEPEYRDIVPLYISQIYFYQERYEEVIANVPPFLEKVSAKDKPELERILALSYYNLGMYEKAAVHFFNYVPTSKTEIDRNDYFAMGYTFYELKDYPKAIDYLSRTTKEKDEMSQTSFYIIGDCYIQTGQLTLASQSFQEASKFTFNPEIREDAMYNYAKLQYATSATPFNMAIKALENYINEYPNSSRSEEANAYLSSIYMSTKNYQAAINSLEKIKSKTPELLRAYQRCTYYRSLELVNSGKNREAVAMLTKSLTYPMDKNMRLSALYWKAETEYRAGQYQEAYYDFQSYHKTENAKKDENYTVSFYSLGYSALKINRYQDAQKAFTTYLGFKETENDPVRTADATARLADTYFMQKDLRNAIRYYEKCESLRQSNADYALFQQAKCYGYLKNNSKKIETLEKLILYYPQSSYMDASEYELATTYHAQNDYTMAIPAYKNFIAKYPKSPYIRQAHNKLAQAYLNTQNEEMAIQTFKYVFEKYPGSQEAKDAMANLENIYTEQGNTTDFFDYIRNKNMNISVSKQDSVSFRAAESKYLRGDCESAVKNFESYVTQFPNGLFAAKAYFYKAECEYGMKDYDAALADYEQIIHHYQTEYNETALRHSASILFNKKEYEKALHYFIRLRETVSDANTVLFAQSGIMHCSYALEKYRESLQAARAVLNAKSNDAGLNSEATLIAGKSAMELGEYTIAKTYLNELASHYSNELAAEAAYYSCLVEFKQGNYDACEELITNMLAGQYSSGSEYWFASVFILYGDVYAAKGNYFQARHTYQSIVDNYEGEDLRERAREKIAALNKLEYGDTEMEDPNDDSDEIHPEEENGQPDEKTEE